MEIYHLFDLESGQTGLLIAKGLCCPVPNAKADNLGPEVVLPPPVENYSLFAACNSPVNQDAVNLLALCTCYTLIFLQHVDNL